MEHVFKKLIQNVYLTGQILIAFPTRVFADIIAVCTVCLNSLFVHVHTSCGDGLTTSCAARPSESKGGLKTKT